MILESEFVYLKQIPDYKAENLLWKGKGSLADAGRHISAVISLLEKENKDLLIKEAEALIIPYAEKEGRGNVLWPVRFALSGKERSVDPWSLITMLGSKESIARLKKAFLLVK